MASELTETETHWICADCGSDEVSVAFWVRPNTGEIEERLFEHVVSDVTSSWCHSCDAEREILERRQ